MRKPKELYCDGFLCLFDKQGEMFFRAKTYIHNRSGNWQFETAHMLAHVAQETTLYPEGLDPCDDPPQWSPAWMDASFLHEGDEEAYDFNFIGHFDIIPDQKNKLRYSFGRVYMEGPGGIGRVDNATDAEGWECQYFDAEIFGTINMDKLRVNID